MAELSSSGKAMPTKSEIIGLLEEHRGAAYVWATLTEKYGPPKYVGELLQTSYPEA